MTPVPPKLLEIARGRRLTKEKYIKVVKAIRFACKYAPTAESISRLKQALSTAYGNVPSLDYAEALKTKEAISRNYTSLDIIINTSTR